MWTIFAIYIYYDNSEYLHRFMNSNNLQSISFTIKQYKCKYTRVTYTWRWDALYASNANRVTKL